MALPTRCLVEHPSPQSVDFAGTHINLKQLARATGMDHSYLSRCFNGVRPLPSIESCRSLADALGMTLIDFIEALEARVHREMAKKLETRRQIIKERDEWYLKRGLKPVHS